MWASETSSSAAITTTTTKTADLPPPTSSSVNNSLPPPNKPPSRSIYKIRDDFSEYAKLLNEHLVSTQLYDHYMELRPSIFRHAQSFVFGFGKLVRLFFLHFYFYHTIWYFPFTRDRRQAPLDFQHFDSRLLLVFLYLNFYHLVVHKLLVNFLIAQILRILEQRTRVFASLSSSSTILGVIETFIFILIDCFLVYVLLVKCRLTVKLIAVILLPHIVFKVIFFSI